MTSFLKTASGLVGLMLFLPVYADEIVVNPGFEKGAQDKTGEIRAWGKIPEHYRLLPRGGRNGTAAIYFERSVPGKQERLLQEVKLVPGKKYRYHGWIKIEDIAGSKVVGASVGFLYFDKNGKQIGSHARPGSKGSGNNGKWLCHKGTTRAVPAGTAKAYFGPFVHDGLTGKAWFDDVMIEPVEEKPVDVLLSSAYRNGAKDGKVTFIALLNVLTNEMPLATLDAVFGYRDASGRMQKRRAGFLANDAAKLELDVKELALGRQKIVFDLAQNTTGKPVGSAEMEFERFAELPKRHVYIDRHGRTILDGKPFFPLGVFAGKVTGDKFKALSESPFNCVMSYEDLGRTELDLLHSKGIYTIYNLCNAWVGEKVNPPIKTREDEVKYLESKVSQFKDHPGLLAWYTNDEKPSSMREQLIRRRELMERLDPGHPTWSVLFQVLEMRSYFPTVDVIGSDPYPVPMYDLNAAHGFARMTREGTYGMRAFWQVPQIFDWAIYSAEHGSKAPPTLFEMRSLAWQSIAGGANGLVFFSFGRRYTKVNGHTFETRWPDVKAMGEEIRRYIPAMLSVEKAPAACSGDADVPVRVWKHEGKVYLLVVNARKDKQSFEGKVTLDSPFKSVEAGFGPQAKSHDGKSLSLSMGPYESAMYIID
jgi:hypothetical protein